MSNPNTDSVIMGALQQILPVGTSLLSKNPAGTVLPDGTILTYGPVYVEDEGLMGRGPFPALLLHAGSQVYTRNSTSTYDGVATINCEYADKWDSQPNTITAVRNGIKADLEIMKHNVGRNESLQIGLTAYAVSVPRISLSPYMGMFDEKLVPGFTIVKRVMQLTINVLPYDEL